LLRCAAQIFEARDQLNRNRFEADAVGNFRNDRGETGSFSAGNDRKCALGDTDRDVPLVLK
jgi:hypothetical protein